MKKLTASIFLVLLFTVADAKTNLDECRQAARENFPEIRKLDIIRATRDCNLKNASMSWLPQIQIGGQFNWVNNVNDINDMFANAGSTSSRIFHYVTDKILHLESERPTQYVAGVSVSQNVWDGGASSLVKKAAEAEADSKEAEVEVNLLTVEEQVDEVYFSILLLEQRLEQAEGKIGVLKDNSRKLRNLYNEGYASEMDLSKMEVEILTSEQKVEEIRSGLKVFRMSLSLLTGMNMIDEELEIPEEPVPETGFTRPEFLLLETRKKMLSLKEKKLDVELMPKLALFADAGYGYPNRNLFANLTGHNPAFNAQAGIKLGFNITPIYTRKRDKAIIRNQMDYLDIQKDILNFKYDMENRQLTQEAENMRNNLQRDGRILELRSQLRIATEKHLEEGEIDLTELLKNINEENDAALQLSIHKLSLLKTLHRQSRLGK